MPFFNHNVDLQDNHDDINIQSVAVLANFNASGKIKPEYIRYTLYDQSIATVKVESIKYRKDYGTHIVFCCLFTNYGRQNEVLLTYHINDHRWSIQF